VIDMKNGDVQGLVAQDPVRMGYLGVTTMIKHLQGAKVDLRIDTGVRVFFADPCRWPGGWDRRIASTEGPPSRVVTMVLLVCGVNAPGLRGSSPMSRWGRLVGRCRRR
jgi:hypothetical protein